MISKLIELTFHLVFFPTAPFCAFQLSSSSLSQMFRVLRRCSNITQVIKPITRDVGGGEECVVSVEWSEAIISCAGSVSQYVLSVTPPTSDCQSSPDCMVMNGSSVITRPGTESHCVQSGL